MQAADGVCKSDTQPRATESHKEPQICRPLNRLTEFGQRQGCFLRGSTGVDSVPPGWNSEIDDWLENMFN